MLKPGHRQGPAEAVARPRRVDPNDVDLADCLVSVLIVPPMHLCPVEPDESAAGIVVREEEAARREPWF